MDNRLLEDVAEHSPIQVEWRQSQPAKQGAGRAPRSSSIARKATTVGNWRTWSATSNRCRFRPNRFRPANGELTEAQERGKAIFERTRKKAGAPIPPANQCPVCHSGPHYTNLKMFDVGSGEAHRPVAPHRHAAVDQHRADRAVPA